MSNVNETVAALQQQVGELTRKVRELQDEREVLALVHRYSEYHDGGKAREFADLFAEDALMEWYDPSFKGGMESHKTVGRQAILEWVTKHSLALARRATLVSFSLPLVKMEGAKARVEAQVISVFGTPEGPHFNTFGLLDCQLAKQDGRWLISRWALNLLNRWDQSFSHSGFSGLAMK